MSRIRNAVISCLVASSCNTAWAEQPLATALEAWAHSRGWQLLYDDGLTSGMQAHEVKQGALDLDALAQLLQGTGLTYRMLNERTVSIVPVSSKRPAEPTSATGSTVASPAVMRLAQSDAASGAELEEVVVQGARELFRPTTASSSTKFDLPLFDTPQSVTVITNDLIKLTQPENLLDMMRFVAGVDPTSTQSEFDFATAIVMARGFQIPLRDGYKINGFSADGRFSPDPVSVERMEILKGPSSIIFGVNNYGGTVNTLIKRPQKKRAIEAAASVGSYDFLRGEFDATGPFTEGGGVRYRLTGAVQEQDSIKRGETYERYSATPSMSFDVGERMTVNLLGFWQRMKAVSDQGFNMAADENGNLRFPTELSRKTFYGRPDINSNRVDHVQAMADFSYELPSRWKLKGAVGYSKNEQFGRQIYVYNFGFAADPYVSVYAQQFVSNLETKDAELSFGGDFEAFGRDHTFLMTTEYRRLKVDAPTYLYSLLSPPVDMFNPDFTPYAMFPQAATEQNGVEQDKRDHYGISAQVLFRMTDKLSLLLGGRFNRTDLRVVYVKEESANPDDPDYTPYDIRASDRVSKFIPRAGLVYSLSANLNTFLSYSEGFIPLTGITRRLATLPPESGRQYEAGIKGEFRDKRLGIQLSAYRIDRENAETSDPNNAPGETFAIAGRNQRHQGVELELFGEVAPNLNAIATYAYLDAEITRDVENPALVGVRPAQVRDTKASVYLNYSFPAGPLRGFSLGAGGTYTGGYPQNESLDGTRMTFPTQLVWDAYLEYRKRDRYSLSLSMENVTNEKDIVTPYSRRTSYLRFSEPRTARLTLRYKF